MCPCAGMWWVEVRRPLRSFTFKSFLIGAISAESLRCVHLRTMLGECEMQEPREHSLGRTDARYPPDVTHHHTRPAWFTHRLPSITHRDVADEPCIMPYPARCDLVAGTLSVRRSTSRHNLVHTQFRAYSVSGRLGHLRPPRYRSSVYRGGCGSDIDLPQPLQKACRGFSCAYVLQYV